MVSSDTVVGIVGAVILTGAMIAVFYYEAGREPTLEQPDVGEGSDRFLYTWEESSVTREPSTSGLMQGETENFDLDPPAYPAQVHIEVRWTQPSVGGAVDAPRQPQFQVEVAGHAEDGATSPVTLTHTFSGNQSAPADILVAGDNETHAQQNLDAHLMDAKPGALRATVTLLDDGYPDELPSQVPRDATNYTIHIEIRYWTPMPATTPEA